MTPATTTSSTAIARHHPYLVRFPILGRTDAFPAPGGDIGWSVPSDQLFRWWLDQERAIGLLLYGRKLWDAMSSHWPTGDQQPNATPAQIELARNWRDTPTVVFSSATVKVDWNTRLVTGGVVARRSSPRWIVG